MSRHIYVQSCTHLTLTSNNTQPFTVERNKLYTAHEDYMSLKARV